MEPSATTVTTHIGDLPDYVLEYVFSIANPYQDLDNIRLVCSRWYYIAERAIQRMKRVYKAPGCRFFWSSQNDEDVAPLTERCSHSACYLEADQSMYVFGGCTNAHTAFNDLWRYDLSSRRWHRVFIPTGPMPTPKALATLVPYKNNLLLFGGFSKSSPNPIHQTSDFYDELHLFDRSINRWQEVVTEGDAPSLAGHSATIIDDFMVVFGGSMGDSSNDEIWVLDITRCRWMQPPMVAGPKPAKRYSHALMVIGANDLIIVGGCGGPNVFFTDVWRLHFDLEFKKPWKWSEVNVRNGDLWPPHLWYHQMCKISGADKAIVVSRPVRNRLRHSPHRRQRHSQGSDKSSPRRKYSSDFQQEKAAVEARPVLDLPKRKGTLLSSKSLDEDASPASPTSPPSSPPTFALHRPPELQRARSIPAIIVGEIPKLVVTASHADAHDADQPSTSSSSGVGSSTSSVSEESSKFTIGDEESEDPDTGLLRQCRMNYYLHLVQQEHQKLLSARQSLSPQELEKRLEQVLCNRLSHVSSREISQTVRTYLRTKTARIAQDAGHDDSRSGQLRRFSDRPPRLPRLVQQHETSSFDRLVNSLSCGRYRQLTIYELDISNVLSDNFVSWDQHAVEEDAAEDLILFSMVEGRGELIMFAGLRTEQQPDNLRVARSNSITKAVYLLRPNYCDF
ncbi:hypothetical protein QR680_014222 [Steinernema hermaphroditum]|uniref:F-box domain-containing protein n=1 Tax=Steinernema hermaphroditum TaxID=289476 RepID=A0AA39I846_9BILA|nr:hypothetical protein QR680_014222 [Steinernema hermaphroditum]